MSMNAYERVACGEYLSAFPDDKTFDEVMQMLRDRDDEVLIWEVFEEHQPEAVAKYITHLMWTLEDTFLPKEQE